MLGGIALSQVLADGLEVVFEDVHGFNFPGSDGLTIPGSEKEVKRFLRPGVNGWRGAVQSVSGVRVSSVKVQKSGASCLKPLLKIGAVGPQIESEWAWGRERMALFRERLALFRER
jgi:hypothetical protein